MLSLKAGSDKRSNVTTNTVIGFVKNLQTDNEPCSFVSLDRTTEMEEFALFNRT